MTTRKYKDRSPGERVLIVAGVVGVHLGVACVLTWLVPSFSFSGVVLGQCLWLSVVAAFKAEDKS